MIRMRLTAFTSSTRPGPTRTSSAATSASAPRSIGKRQVESLNLGRHLGVAPFCAILLSGLLQMADGRQHELAIAFVDADDRAVGDFARQDLVGERILQIFLHRAL